MKKLNIQKMVQDLLHNRPNEVIEVIKDVGIEVPNNVTQEQLLYIIKTEAQAGNKGFVDKLALLINKTFDLSPIFDEAKQSQFSGIDSVETTSHAIEIIGEKGISKIVYFEV